MLIDSEKKNEKKLIFDQKRSGKLLLLNRTLLLIIIFLSSIINQGFGFELTVPNDSILKHHTELYNAFYSEYSNLYDQQQFKEINALITQNLISGQYTGVHDSVYTNFLLRLITVTISLNEFNDVEPLLDSLKNVISPDNHVLLARYYRLKGYMFNTKKDYIRAIKNFDRAFYEAGLGKDKNLQGRLLFAKALDLQIMGKRNESLPLFLKADTYINANDEFATDIKQRIASDYSVKGQNDLALVYINEAIMLETTGFSFSSPFDLPLLYQIKNLQNFTGLLQMRSYIFRERAKEVTDSLFFLNQALRDARFSVVTMEHYKNGLGFESDLLNFNQRKDYVYYKAIESIARITDATGNDSLVQEGLEYAEMGKISALLRSIQREQALHSSGIPDSLIMHSEAINKRLHELEAQRYQKQATINFSDARLTNLNQSFYDAIQESKKLESFLEQEYSTYKNLKYKAITPDLNFIYQLSHQKAIIEYVMSDKKLYTFLIVDGKIHFYHTNYAEHFVESIDSLQQAIANGKELTFSLAEQTGFVHLSSFLYQQLVQPFESLIENKPLIIVPDGQLALIPFEVLLTDSVVPSRLNYQALPYLVKEHDISYLYSLTLLEEQTRFAYRPVQDEVLAMAPEYKELAGNKAEQYLAMRDARDNLGVLLGARQEVKQISRMMRGKSMYEDDASEEEFKKESGKYSILHLAMHTLVNNEEPNYSKLVFTPDADKHDDGLLNTYELADLKLNADLVVLSACNTGFGKLNKGEGIIGLARGFFKAGCKSLVATLWSVSDRTSMQVMKTFYRGLERRKDKAYSISKAKRNYLAHNAGMYAHPYFWAGYIVIGNTDPVNISRFPYSGWALVLILSSVLIVGFFSIRWWKYHKIAKAG